jgi:Fic family protein
MIRVLPFGVRFAVAIVATSVVASVTRAATQPRVPDRSHYTRLAALSAAIDKARYWEKLRDVPLNERQRLVINRLLEGFEGKLTTSKWAALTKSSNDTALRDIQQLVERGVLVRNQAGGRSTSYSLAGL